MKALRCFIFITYTILFLAHCPIIYKITGPKTSRVTGQEARNILKYRLAALYINDFSTNSADSLNADFLIPQLAGLQDGQIYRRRDVESCATKTFLAAIAIDQPAIIRNRTKKASDPLVPSDPNSRLVPPLLCRLQPVNDLIDLD